MGAGASQFFGGGSIADIIAAAGQAAKTSGLTMDNKALKKLGSGPGGNAGARSQTSKGTRKTDTKSRKSKHEEDFENMEIEEVEILIENAEREMKQAADAKRKITRGKQGTAKAKEAKLAPFEMALTHLRNRITMLLRIKDAKIPFYDKLPKDNQFYKHFMQNLGYQRMKDSAMMKAEEDKMLFRDATEKITMEHDKAIRSISPGGRNGRRLAYD